MTAKSKLSAFGIALGAALGAIAGVMAGHMVIWLAIGVAIGVAIGGALRRKGSDCPQCAALHQMHQQRTLQMRTRS
jgi:RsiW-degrading membrane proteinase PrsW (M82 family)